MTPARLAAIRDIAGDETLPIGWSAVHTEAHTLKLACRDLLAEVDRLTTALVAESMGKSVEAAQALDRAHHLRNAALAALTAAVDDAACPDHIRARGLEALRAAAQHDDYPRPDPEGAL